MRSRALDGGGPDKLAEQHAKGKLSARERLALLLDAGTFDLVAYVVNDSGARTLIVEDSTQLVQALHGSADLCTPAARFSQLSALARMRAALVLPTPRAPVKR